MIKDKEKKKNKNYICPRCFNRVEHCSCEFAPHDLIQVDEPLQKVIKYANNHGIKTVSCCSGHYEEINNQFGTDMHIHFLVPFFEPPTGFCAEKGRCTEGYAVIRHRFKKGLTKEEFEKEQAICIHNIMLWLQERIEGA